LEFNSFIGVSYLEDLTICDDLIDFFEARPELSSVGTAGGRIDVTFKKSMDLSFENVVTELRERYFSQLDNVLRQYKKHYEFADTGVSPWGFKELPNIQRYKPGEGFYEWHNERGTLIPPVCHRHLVYMTYLNDVTDGGETEFFYQQLKIHPRKGMTLIWPTDWTHTHRGITSPTQTKYIVTGWYSFL
jgi:prolyl 4-hydroxylase